MHHKTSIQLLAKNISFNVMLHQIQHRLLTGFEMVIRYEKLKTFYEWKTFKLFIVSKFQIQIDEKYVIQTKGLLIKNVQESDDGIYTCRAAVFETGELTERNIRLEVQVYPKVQPFTVELEGVEDQPFSVKCNATGKPVPSYTWIKDSEQLNLETSADR